MRLTIRPRLSMMKVVGVNRMSPKACANSPSGLSATLNHSRFC